ncbi:MAG: division/cell wall cluster transcriptional repressor MraZ [Candidatus Pacebacteria bacterium]|nr:division/cell wall cluster transcriptional repressor MraZ [Candidatus Paceibacterota bacterium]
MFVGKFYYKLQAKDRISLPADFRNQADSWIVTRGLDGCLFVYNQDKFETELAKLGQRSFTKKSNRDLVRLMTNEAQEVQADANGRVRLPRYLIEYAGLEKELVIVGSFNRIEIWDRNTYHDYMSQLEDQAEQIAESIDD